ncbi:MAG: ammonia monooxygenase [Actinobacteria bacterium]|nr:MAG: ammonia monooxygenase [Actinomycetota bacterium]
MAALGILRTIEGGSLGFWCPGCQEMHAVNSGWAFNGNYERPTFTPSVLVTGGHYVPGWQGPECWCTYNAAHPEQAAPFRCERCHSFVTDGAIAFLSDCTHELAGKTVPLKAPPV